MHPPMQIHAIVSSKLGDEVRTELLRVCNDAYREDISGYLTNIGPGLHLLGRVDGELVAHAMIVERTLQVARAPVLRTAYVELVATHPKHQRRGYASRLLREIVPHIQSFDIAALSPSAEEFYARLGWQSWRGELSVRRESAVEPTPNEVVMVMPLPRTPPSLSLDEPLSIEWRTGEIW
jgi:aminoglycoside 2'-N-acetyltransferase I